MNPKYLIEFIGTFFLVLVIALTGNPIAIAGILMVMVYLGGYISGAHFNPAVSTTMYLQKKIDSTTLLKYSLTQVLAAMAATLVFKVMTNSDFYVVPGLDVTFWNALLAEMIFTFALCSVVLHTAVSEKTKGNSYFGLAIGATVGVAAFSIGSISGAALNPAVGIGPLLVNPDLLSSSMSSVGLYIIGPLAGAVIASLLYTVTNKK